MVVQRRLVIGAALFWSLFAADARAQTDPPTFAVVGGLNYSTFVGAGASHADPIRTFVVGGRLSWSFGDYFGLQPELLIDQKGAATTSDLDEKLTLKIAYLELPVLAKVHFAPLSSAWRPYLVAGPVVGVKAGCTYEVSTPDFTGSANCTKDAFNIRSTEFSGVGGVGISFRAYSLDLRYVVGLSNIDPDLSGPEEVKKNRVISLILGYRLGPPR